MAETSDDESKNKKKGWALISHDFKQKELIPIKILSFAILASKLNDMIIYCFYKFVYVDLAFYD